MAYYRCMMSGGSGGFPVTLTVTCDSAFAGETLYLTKGLTVLSKTVPATGIVEFEFPENGTWILSNSLISDTETFENVGEYELDLHAIPDGKTVLPVNDIQIWLKCASIFNKSYTTLGEVLADSVTLSRLMSSNNAVDYLVRSTEWAESKALVPVMTSDTEPSGEASAISVSDSNHQAWCAFNRNNDRFWMPAYANPQNPWVQYAFSDSVEASKATLIMTADSQGGTPQTITATIQGSNDGTNFVNISSSVSISGTNSPTTYNIDLTVGAKYRYYRVQFTGYMVERANINRRVAQFQLYSPSIPDNQDAMSYIGLNNYAARTLIDELTTWRIAICKSQYFESVLNAKVPAMTSETTPEGECFMDSQIGGGHPYQAFDGNDSTYAQAYQNGGPISGNLYIGYAFVNPIEVVMARAYTKVYSKYSGITIQAGNSRSSYTNLTALETTGIGSKDVTTILSNTDEYTVHRAILSETQAATGLYFYPDVSELQFYGRQDV